jgi:penicillin amidase
MNKRTIIFTSLALLLITTFLFSSHLAWQQADTSHERDSVERLAGLQGQVTVVRDKDGVPHLTASSDHDVYFLMGYLHARDRFFQMDIARRLGGGTLAELLGEGPGDLFLGEDVLHRIIGIDRAAERSLNAYSPEAAGLIQAYSDGVNVWLDRNSLPPEYAALEITQVPRWTPLDSVRIVKFIQFQLSFDVSDIGNTLALSIYQFVGQLAGFDGTRLFFDDLFTVAPFDPVATIPGTAGIASPSSHEIQSRSLKPQVIEQARRVQGMSSPAALEAARKFLQQYDRSPLWNRNKSGVGSNWWVVAGSKTETGNAMLANDPHLALMAPATYYEIHLTVDSDSSPMNVYGVSYPGVPGVFLGQNDHISWGATNSSLDITDHFIEQCVLENDGTPVATLYKGVSEPLVVVPEEYRMNQVQNGVADDIVVVSPGNRPSGVLVDPQIFVAPRRNNGALLPGAGEISVSIQYAGASATRDLEGIFALARARNLTDFKQGLQFLEVGSLNWAYADVDGNIATFVNGKVPIREDLQAGVVDGVPPFFVRDGTGAFRNEWVPRSDTSAGFKYESYSFEEMPQTVNPAQGFLVNANNDPLGIMLDNDPLNQIRGGGIYYLSGEFNPGFRAAKITSLLKRELDKRHGHGKVSFEDMQRIQSNVQMFDAEVFRPYIIRAFQAARRPGAPAELAALANDPAVREAVERLSDWDFSAPTGISEGYDAGDLGGGRKWPSANEVSNSVAATIYTVWRNQILANTILAALQRVDLTGVQPGLDRLLVNLRFMLDNFSSNQGVGASGLNFFEVPGIDAQPGIRRDILILKSVKDALNLLAGDAFADAFNRSTNQSDYRWGKLHRITFSHIFGGLAPQFSVPTAGNFADLAPTLPGLATDGGFETIDNAPSNAIDPWSHAYTFGVGPARRYVGELRRGRIKSVQIIPGGQSGVPDNRFYVNQLSSWLTNDYHRILFANDEIDCNRYSKTVYRPGR